MNTITQDIATAAEPLFCKDCRHISAATKGTGPTCGAKGARITDLVQGYLRPDCRNVRLQEQACGPAGLLFEPAAMTPAHAALDAWASKKPFPESDIVDRQREPYEGLSTPISDRSRSSLSMKNRASVVSSANTLATTEAGTLAPSTDVHIDFAVTNRS